MTDISWLGPPIDARPLFARQQATWRLCTRGVTPEQAAGNARIEGDEHLAAAALRIVSIIWSPPNPEGPVAGR